MLHGGVLLSGALGPVFGITERLHRLLYDLHTS
jgi:hypothetical protein